MKRITNEDMIIIPHKYAIELTYIGIFVGSASSSVKLSERYCRVRCVIFMALFVIIRKIWEGETMQLQQIQLK